jgi:hypothetical protein
LSNAKAEPEQSIAMPAAVPKARDLVSVISCVLLMAYPL